MSELYLQITIDGIAKTLLDSGKTPEQIREILTEEADRVADEIESGEWD